MGTPHRIILNVLWVWVVSYHFHVAVSKIPQNFRPLSAFPALLENHFLGCHQTLDRGTYLECAEARWFASGRLGKLTGDRFVEFAQPFPDSERKA